MNQKSHTAPPIALPFTISIIVISFAAIFVKWSAAPPTILAMYRMYIACFFLLPVIWMKRAEFKKITRKNWLLLVLSGGFFCLHFDIRLCYLDLINVAVLAI